MTKSRILFAVSIVILALSAWLCAACRPEPEKQSANNDSDGNSQLTKIVHWTNGTERAHNALAPAHATICAEVDSILAQANDALLLLVGDHLIANIRSGEALELSYPAPRKVLVGSASFEFQHLLIPLISTSGLAIPESATVVFCGNPKYSSAPLVSTRSLDQLRNLLQ